MSTASSPSKTKLYRSFRTDAGRPSCGNAASMLGVRVSGPVIDLVVDEAGRVRPGRGGMSVAPNDPRHLPPFLRPTSLGGHGKLPLFVIESDALGLSLAYRPDPSKPTKHGFVEPRSTMSLIEYSKALAATAGTWKEVTT